MNRESTLKTVPILTKWSTAQRPQFEQLFGAEREQVLRRVEALGRLMDDLYLIPGTNIRIGLDTLIGLVPVVGDTVTTALSSYVIWEARRMGVSKWTILKMLKNLGIDFIVGAVPLVGDLFDVAWRANRKNIKLLHDELLQASLSPRSF